MAIQPSLAALPDEILHTIFSFVADYPHQIGPYICWSMRPLSNSWRTTLDNGRADLWALAVLDLSCSSYRQSSYGQHDEREYSKKKVCRKRCNASIIQTSTGKFPPNRIHFNQLNAAPPRRSTRLRSNSPKERYIHLYELLLLRTEAAIFQTTEHCHSKKNSLSCSKLHKLLKEYEPIAINQRARIGGTFLVEICRARYVSEGVILKCVKLLIEEHGANPNVPSAEYSSKNVVIHAPSTCTSMATCCTSTVGRELYPLIIAAARGMPSVVKYLLSVGAKKTMKGSSRFRLFSNAQKSVNGINLNALEFAQKMKEQELASGLMRRDILGLNKVITVLEQDHLLE